MNTKPIAPFVSWTSGWTDVLNTGTWRSALPIHEWRPSPCHVLCPVGGAIPQWTRPLAEGDYQAAWLALSEENPLPAVTGRVCHHPCESSCNRSQHDEAVAINALEHFLGDLALDSGWALPAPGSELGRRVAVVGGGPAGLASAYHLRRLGYGVTIFEGRGELGGLLRYAIPEYRLPLAVLEKEISRLLEMGMEVRLKTPVPDGQALEALLGEYQAVFLALGAQRARKLEHLDSGAGFPVFDGLEFLAWSKAAEERDQGTARDLSSRLGAHVAVIGGGSAAMDVARSARRLGKTVTVICLEERQAMPAQPAEVAEALEEAIFLYEGAMVQSVDRQATGSLVLNCLRITLDQAAEPALLRPLPVAGSAFQITADSILVSVGQEAVLDGWGDLLATEDGLVAVDRETLRTSRPGLYAGGDVAGNVRFVSQALGDGRRAARSIAAYLGNSDSSLPSRYLLEDAVQPTEVNLHYFAAAPRTERKRVSTSERLTGFREVASVLSVEEARAEAERCLSCGSCLRCDICSLFCPDMALRRDSNSDHPYDKNSPYYVLDQYCKGCGLCAAECPRGVVRLLQEQR